MYKKSQLKRINRLAAVCRATSTALIGLAAIIFIAVMGPTLSLEGQIVLGSGIFIFVWLMLLSLMRKQESTTRRVRRDARKYSLDFD